MDLPQNLTAFLKSLPIKTMSGNKIIVAIVYFLAKGNLSAEIETNTVKKSWSKTLLGKKYNDSFMHRALGYIHSCAKGKICLTQEGVDYINDFVQSVQNENTSLKIFSNNNSHSFDKFIRNLFKKASKTVDIADGYVSGAIFDNLLDEVPKNVTIRFLFGKDTGGFTQRANRFAKEYEFEKKQSNNFHDRFIIIDGIGYIIGPSLKDAADKKPASLVSLNKNDSVKLIKLFTCLW